MLKKIKNLLLWMLMLVMLLGSMNLEVLAAGNAAKDEEMVEFLEAEIKVYEPEPGIMPITRFGDATISVSRDSQGMLICITTMTDGVASIIGVKDIKVKHKVWWGWETVATSDGGYVNNSGGMSCTLHYAGAIQGDTYKVSCVHYADVDGYHELESETSGFIYNF